MSAGDEHLGNRQFMQQVHVPVAGVRYWIALSIASVFGANSGDYVAKYLHLGHVGGLPALALLLTLIFLAERRDRSVHQAYYWLSIVVVRTAATNLADFGASDLRLGRLGLVVALSVLLAAVLFFTPPVKSGQASNRWPFGLPVTDARYWACMLIAGTLGTVIGDMASFNSGFGTAYASLIEGSVLVAVLLIGRAGPLTNLSVLLADGRDRQGGGDVAGGFSRSQHRPGRQHSRDRSRLRAYLAHLAGAN